MTEVSELFRSYTMSQNDRTGKIVGHFSCPHQLGNRLFDFLNAFLIAVVTDRALVWRPCRAVAHGICPRNRPDACAGVLDLRAWVRPAGDGAIYRPDYPPRLTRPGFRGPPGYWAHHPAPDQLACCGIDRLSTPMLTAGVLERNDAAARAWPGATLGAAAGRRAAARAARWWRTAQRSTPPSTSERLFGIRQIVPPCASASTSATTARATTAAPSAWPPIASVRRLPICRLA